MRKHFFRSTLVFLGPKSAQASRRAPLLNFSHVVPSYSEAQAIIRAYGSGRYVIRKATRYEQTVLSMMRLLGDPNKNNKTFHEYTGAYADNAWIDTVRRIQVILRRIGVREDNRL